MASNDARGMGMDGRRISSNEEDYVQEGDSSEDFGEHYRGSAVIPASEPSPERPPVVRTSIGMLGEALYPPLQIVEIPAKVDVIQGERIDLNFFMIPTTFNETFSALSAASNSRDAV